MVELCHPYGEGITCLCDHQGQSVLKCFLSIEAAKNSGKSTGRHQCKKQQDTNTEIFLAASIAVMVVVIFIW